MLDGALAILVYQPKAMPHIERALHALPHVAAGQLQIFVVRESSVPRATFLFVCLWAV